MEEQQFQPSWTKEQLKQFTTMYEGRGHLLSPENKQQIDQHAAYYNVPFYEGEGDFLDTIKSAGTGFMEALTLNLYQGDKPKTQTEAIAKNIGHLIGFAPSIVAGPLGKIAKMTKSRTLARMSGITAQGNKISPSMIAADYATKKASSAGNYMLGAMNVKNVDTLKGVNKLLLGGGARNISHQAFHLGIASAAGTLPEMLKGNFDVTMDAFMGGAKAGAIFGSIGNITGPGLKKLSESTNIDNLVKFETTLKTIAGSLAQGGMAAGHGATNPELVYEYLLGAYFGGNAGQWKNARAQKVVNEIRRKGGEGTTAEKDAYKEWERLTGRNLEEHPDMLEEPVSVKEAVRELQVQFGDPGENLAGAHLRQLAEEAGMKVEDLIITAQEKTPEGFIDAGEYVDGKSVVKVKESAIKRDNYIATSGGAGDAVLAEITGQYGLPTINYVPWRGSTERVVGLDRTLTPDKLQEANKHIAKANKTIRIVNPDKSPGQPKLIPIAIAKLSEGARNQIAKNYWAIKNAKEIYLVTEMGGKGSNKYLHNDHQKWPAQFAKDLNKPLFVLDSLTNRWFKWNTQVRNYEALGPYTSPPKPANSISVLGSTNLARGASPNTYKAMHGWLGKHFKKRPIADEIQKRANAANKAKIKDIQKVFTRQAHIQEELKKIEGLEDSDEVLAHREVLETNLKDTKAELVKIEAEASEDLIRQAEQESVKTEEEVAGVDEFGNENTRQIFKKPLQITQDHLKEFWGSEAGIESPSDQRDAKLEIADRVSDIIYPPKGTPQAERFSEKGSEINRSEEAIKAIEDLMVSDYQGEDFQKKGFKLNDVGRGEIRQAITRENLGKPVIHLQSDGVNFFRMKDDAHPVSRGGTRKLQNEPEKYIETVFKNITGDTEPMLLTLDHVTTYNEKRGFNVDMELSRFRATDPKGYAQLVKNASKKAAKEGMYVFGGASDKDRLYFIKYHPESDKLTMRDLIRSKVATSKDLRLSREQSRIEHDLTTEEHDKAFMSNVAYDLSMNGLGVDKAGLAKFMEVNSSFVKGSAPFNKRAQIWFTNSYKADSEFVKKAYESDGGSLNANDKYNVIIVNDLPEHIRNKMDKNHPDYDKNFSHALNSLENVENPEHLDGAIIVPDRLIDVINRDFGVPESGQNKSFIVSPNAEHGALLGKYMMHAAGTEMSKLMEAQGLHMIMQESAVKQRGTREIGDYDIVPSKGLDIKITNFNEIVKTATDNGKIDAKNVWLVGSTAKKGKGKDVDILYEFKDTAFPPKKDPDVTSKEHYEEWFTDFYFEGDLPSISPKYDSIVKIKDTTTGEDLMFQMSPAHPDKLWNYIGKAKDHKPYQNMMVGVKVDLMNPPSKEAGMQLSINAKTYEISPEDVRGSYSVYGNDHFFEAQRIPKQVMMNMLESVNNPMDQGVIDKAFDDIIGSRWRGQDEYNNKLAKYIADSAMRPESIKEMNDIIDNIENISMRDIVEAIRNESSPQLAEAIYQKMLKVTKENVAEEHRDGSISDSEYKEYSAELTEFNSLTDRMIKQATMVSEEARSKGYNITADAIYNHKIIRDFKAKAVQNFLVNSATKPHMGNSGAAYMRPYDKAMQVNLDKVNDLLDRNNVKGINKNDEVFFLDEGHATRKIHLLDAKGVEEVKTLKQVFNEFKKAEGERLDYLTEVLTAATVRVPMDSVSGMQVMKFGGFTGRKGHGILLHSKAMRAEGGADLDGDKAFYYFGGTRGMSKEMMEQFYKNKNEFEYTTGQELTPTIRKRMWISPPSQPEARMKMAAEGRGPIKSLSMSFAFGRSGANRAGSDVQSSNTYDAILEGKRTGTSRAIASGQLNDIKKGDIVWFTAPGKKKIWARVTEKRSLENITPQDWANKEGYNIQDVIANWESRKQYKNKYEQILFEPLFTPKAGKGEVYTKDNKKAKISKTIGKFKEGTSIRELLIAQVKTGGDRARMELANSATSHYAPAERIRISEAAVDGRNQLGPAVSNSQLMKGAYNSIVASGGSDVLQFGTYIKDGDGKNILGKDGKPIYKNFNVLIKAKTDDADVKFQRDMARAQLGLASDPMDELGLAGINAWKKLLWDAHFEAVDVVEVGFPKRSSKYKKNIIAQLADAKKLKFGYTNSGIFGDFVNLNKGLWGRDYTEGRKYNMDEIHNFLGSATNLMNVEGASNSFLPKIGNLFSGLDWSDSPFIRLNEGRVAQTYLASNKKIGSRLYLQGLLGRSSMKVPYTNQIKAIFKHKIFNKDKRFQIANDVDKFFDVIKDTPYEKRADRKKAHLEKGEEGFKDRLNMLNEMLREGEDYIVNDMTDMVTLNLIEDVMERGKISPERFQEISKHVDSLKKRSYLMARDRAKLEAIIEEVSDKNLTKLFEEYLVEKFGKQPKSTSKDTSRTAELDQSEIDSQIAKFRVEKRLNKFEIELYDQLMLGSINRGKQLDKIVKMESEIKNWKNNIARDYIKHLRDLNSKSNISRLGFSSMEVGNDAIRKHLKGYMEMMSENSIPLNAKELAALDAAMNNAIDTPPVIPETIHKMATNTGFEKIDFSAKPVKDKELASLIAETGELLKFHPNIVGGNKPDVKSGQALNEFVRGLPFIKKDFDSMSIADIHKLNIYLKQTKEGTVWQRLKKMFGKDEKALSFRHYQSLPSTVDRELQATDIDLVRKEGYFTDAQGEIQLGKIRVPTQFMDTLSSGIGNMIEMGTQVGDGLVSKFQEDQMFYQGLEEAPGLWEYAIRTREHEGRHEYRKTREEMGKSSSETEQAIIYMRDKLNDAHKKLDWTKVKDKEYFVNIDGQRLKQTGQQIVDRINGNLTQYMEDMHTVIRGKEEMRGEKSPYFIEWYDPMTKKSPKYNHNAFLKDLDIYVNGRVPTRWKKLMKSTNESIPSIFGIDGVRSMMREMHIEFGMDIGRAHIARGEGDLGKSYIAKSQKLAAFPIKETGQLPFHTYFPRMFFEPSVVKENLKAANERVMNLQGEYKGMDGKAQLAELVKLQQKHKRLDGDYNFDELRDTDKYDELFDAIKGEEEISDKRMENWFNMDASMGNMRSREYSTPGWSVAPTAVEAYARSLSNTYFKGLAGMLSRNIVSNPKTGIFQKLKVKWGTDQAKAWTEYAKLYVNDALGNPITISKELAEDPIMALKRSPYKMWADNRLADRVGKIAARLGLKGMINKDGTIIGGVDVYDLRRWSQMEAKFEMAALLAHPKSVTANILGGSLHTIQSAGLTAYRNVRNYEYLQKINPALKSRKDVEDMVINHGVLPQWMIYELGMQKEFQSNEGKNALKLVENVFKRNPNITPEEMKSQAKILFGSKARGISDAMTQFAAKFMTVPERALRTDAFMAHYLKAWESFGGAIKDPNHPFLIEMGKKGVQATQFLYNAPNRPAYARTSLGKVMTRFQMYAWNSVRLRGDMMRKLEIAGYDPNSPEGKEAQRFIAGDMFMLALANMFPYSLFENNLPQPFGWFQDTADWIFGNEQERDRAFFGTYPTSIAPLQVITPPIGRAGLLIHGILNGDMEKVSNYYMWTMFPFGRIVRDIVGKGGIAEAPIRLVDKLTGIPLTQIQRKAKRLREEEFDILYPKAFTGGYE